MWTRLAIQRGQTEEDIYESENYFCLRIQGSLVAGKEVKVNSLTEQVKIVNWMDFQSNLLD